MSARATRYHRISPRDLPESRLPNGIIAVAWADLLSPEGGEISYELRGSAPSRRLVVTWNGVPTWYSELLQVTAQAILYEEGSRIEIHTTVQPVGLAFTRGVESPDGTEAAFLPGEDRGTSGPASSAVAFYTSDAPGDVCDPGPATISCP
jgi:hypothetical protein